MGFRGIAIGTVIAYMAGGLIQFGVLVSGRGKLRLFLHRLRPHWTTLRRDSSHRDSQRRGEPADVGRCSS